MIADRNDQVALFDATLGRWPCAEGLGGRSLGAHHAYDPVRSMLSRGDGARRSSEQMGLPIEVSGLLRTLTDPNGGTWTYRCDARGLLQSDKDAGSGQVDITRQSSQLPIPPDKEVAQAYQLDHATAGGKHFRHDVVNFTDGSAQRPIATPDGTSTIDIARDLTATGTLPWDRSGRQSRQLPYSARGSSPTRRTRVAAARAWQLMDDPPEGVGCVRPCRYHRPYAALSTSFAAIR